MTIQRRITASTLGDEGANHQQQAAQAPELPGVAVGGIPIFLAFQSPLDADAHGAVLLCLGHIVADEEKQQAHEEGEQRGDKVGRIRAALGKLANDAQ